MARSGGRVARAGADGLRLRRAHVAARFRETFRELLMLVATGSAPHPDGTECDPAYWWEALCQAGDGPLDRASAIGVAAQQHGMVALDDAGEVIRPAILWNDMRAAPQTRDLIAELGGPAEWARRTGSVPAVSFTVTKLRWMAEREPESVRRLHRVVLPHDWLTWRLGADEPVTD